MNVRMRKAKVTHTVFGALKHALASSKPFHSQLFSAQYSIRFTRAYPSCLSFCLAS